MNSKENKVLKALIENVRQGGNFSDVFDLMYETSLPYCELKDILDSLILQNEVECLDIRNYKFVGDISRDFDEDEPVMEEKSPEDNWALRKALEERRLYLQMRMRNILSMQQNLCDDDDCYDYDWDDDDCDDNDIIAPDFLESDEAEEDYETDNNEKTLYNKLLKILTDNSEEGKLVTSALKLCASEGYITERMLSKNLNIEDVTANTLCIWLFFNGFIGGDGNDERFESNISEGLFLNCCMEAQKRKNSIGKLSGTLKSIALQKQMKEEARRLRDIILSDTSLNRAETIIKAEGCLWAACNAGDENSATFYENIVNRLKGMSDYIFNRLKNQLAG